MPLEEDTIVVLEQDIDTMDLNGLRFLAGQLGVLTAGTPLNEESLRDLIKRQELP